MSAAHCCSMPAVSLTMPHKSVDNQGNTADLLSYVHEGGILGTLHKLKSAVKVGDCLTRLTRRPLR